MIQEQSKPEGEIQIVGIRQACLLPKSDQAPFLKNVMLKSDR